MILALLGCAVTGEPAPWECDARTMATGEVRVRLYKGKAEAIGRRSPRSLYRQDLATFGTGMAYDHKDAEGFIRLFGLPERVRALTRDRVPVDVKAVEVEG